MFDELFIKLYHPILTVDRHSLCTVGLFLAENVVNLKNPWELWQYQMFASSLIANTVIPINRDTPAE